MAGTSLVLLIALCLRSSIADPSSRLLYVFPQDTIVQVDSTAVFICRARAPSPPVITWKVNGKHVNRARYSIATGIGALNGTSTLTIENVRSNENNSTITCIANSQGATDTHTIRLTVLNPGQVPAGFPSFKETRSAVKAVEKGYATTLTCPAAGDPTPEVIWLKESLPLDLRNPRYNASGSGSLHIQNVEQSDDGAYSCLARNRKGAAYLRLLRLYVKTRRVAPQFFIRPNTTYTVPMGGSLEITCAAVGHPVPTVSWTLLPTDGQASTAASENVITGLKEEALGRKVLKLTNMAKTVRLKCRADSNLGAIEAISTVRVSGTRGPTSQDFVISENHA